MPAGWGPGVKIAGPESSPARRKVTIPGQACFSSDPWALKWTMSRLRAPELPDKDPNPRSQKTLAVCRVSHKQSPRHLLSLAGLLDKSHRSRPIKMQN